MKKSALIAFIIDVYGVYPPEGSSYDDLKRLRDMLIQHGRPKQSFLDKTAVLQPQEPSFPTSEGPFYVDDM